MKRKKELHIAIIILGILFLLLAAFHEDIWFDESYSVAIARHDFAEIWTISGNDVHPPLYYWMLHIIGVLTNYNVIVYRLFSVLAIALVGILGYTHIRKEFGEKTGILFSFLTYFLPVMCTYSQEIRMYSWSCLFVTLLGIYAWRLYQNVKNIQNKEKSKNLILFGICSICCCYIHYYALVTTGIVNLILLIYLIRNRKQEKVLLRNFLILAVIQIILYIPWLVFFVGQLLHVGGGFWIKLGINTLVEVPSFQFRRQLDTNFAFNTQTIIALIASIGMYIFIAYQIYKAKKEKQEMMPGILALGVYIAVIVFMLIVSLVTPILFSRYLLVMTGLYIFGLSFFMAKEKRTWVIILISTIILILGIISNVTNMAINYDSSNMKQIEYLKENIKKEDIIVYSNIGNGGVIAAFFPENKQYFYNGAYWDIEEAYKAYGPGMETIYDYNSILENYTGRIWLIDSEYMGLYDEFPKENIRVIEGPTRFDTKYQNYIYNIMLLEKEN